MSGGITTTWRPSPGLGVDLEGIVLVVYWNPRSMAEMVQMFGRAGRDGDPATGAMLSSGRISETLQRYCHAECRDVTGHPVPGWEGDVYTLWCVWTSLPSFFLPPSVFLFSSPSLLFLFFSYPLFLYLLFLSSSFLQCRRDPGHFGRFNLITPQECSEQ